MNFLESAFMQPGCSGVEGGKSGSEKRWAIGIEEEKEEEKVFCAHFLSPLLFRTDGKGQKMTILVSSVGSLSGSQFTVRKTEKQSCISAGNEDSNFMNPNRAQTFFPECHSSKPVSKKSRKSHWH